MEETMLTDGARTVSTLADGKTSGSADSLLAVAEAMREASERNAQMMRESAEQNSQMMMQMQEQTLQMMRLVVQMAAQSGNAQYNNVQYNPADNNQNLMENQRENDAREREIPEKLSEKSYDADMDTAEARRGAEGAVETHCNAPQGNNTQDNNTHADSADFADMAEAVETMCTSSLQGAPDAYRDLMAKVALAREKSVRNAQCAMRSPQTDEEEATLRRIREYEPKRANDVMADTPLDCSKRLLGPLMRKGELVGLVAESNSGKTILAMQLAEFWASGGKFQLGTLKNEAGPQKVVFFSAEMGNDQMRRRYSDDQMRDYKFSDNLYFVSENLNSEENVRLMVETVVEKAHPDVIVIDSLCQVADSDITKMTAAKPLLNFFKDIAHGERFGYKMGVFVILHTRKRQTQERRKDAMDKYSLFGSSGITNTFDSIIALDTGLREPVKILTQVKSREGDIVYNNDNALMMSIVKEDPDSFLRFVADKVAPIGNLLTERKGGEEDAGTARLKAIVRECYKRGVVTRHMQMRKFFGVSGGSASRWLEQLKSGVPLESDYALTAEDWTLIQTAEDKAREAAKEAASREGLF